MTDWDGTERRAANLVNAQSQARQAVEVPVVILIVGFAAVVLFQMAALIQHALINADVEREAKAAAQARSQISCFVVGTAQGRLGSDLLTTCGFLRIGNP